jgi:hypothetical protein
MTALRCGNCHRVAGEATTDADIETSVIVDRRFQDDKGWWSSRGDTWGIFVADIEKHADAWPLRWPCPTAAPPSLSDGKRPDASAAAATSGSTPRRSTWSRVLVDK